MTVDELIDRLTEMPGWMVVTDTAGQPVEDVAEAWGTVKILVTV